MSQPTVCCVMLTADRPEYAKRAVECFRAQTYENRRLLVYDTGDASEDYTSWLSIIHYLALRCSTSETIGDLRNAANIRACVENAPDIFVHWDDDDWSHPNRIAEQVALMESTGADVCGYNEIIFWRSSRDSGCGTGEAWLYTGSILGTSLCYRRAVWERFPFPDTSYGEDTEWLKRVHHARLKVAAQTTIWPFEGSGNPREHALLSAGRDNQPRMIARIHAGNTSKAYAPEAMRAAPHHWRRAPDWDSHCREVME